MCTKHEEASFMSEEKQNVVIIQDNGGDKRKNKLTWRNYINGIAHKKWWVIGSTLVAGVIGLSVMQWVVNSLRERLTATYKYNLATEVDANGEERFINGQVFNFAMVVNKDTLQSIKDSKDEYKKINIDKLIKESAISVVKNIPESSDKEKDNKEKTYTISAKAKFFPSKEIGRQFVNDLIYSPLELSTTAINNYKVTSYVSDSFEELSYNKKVELLEKQYDAINTAYINLKNKFGANVFGNSDAQTLGQLFGIFSSSNGDTPQLLNSLYANGFVNYETSKISQRLSELENEGKSLAITLRSKQETLDSKVKLLNSMQNATIISTLTSESEYVKEMIELKNDIVEITTEISKIEKNLLWCGMYEESEGNWVFDNDGTHNKTSAYYRLSNKTAEWETANEQYKNKLSESAASLIKDNDTATSVFRFVYSSNNQVSILNSGYIEIKNNIHWSIGLAIGLVLGFAVSSLVVGEIESNKKEEE